MTTFVAAAIEGGLVLLQLILPIGIQYRIVELLQRQENLNDCYRQLKAIQYE
jgi:hypothetical protein